MRREKKADEPVEVALGMVFDALLYRDRPTSDELGLRPILVTDRLMFAAGDMSRGDEAATRSLARLAWSRQSPLVLDIEHWPVDVRTAPYPQVAESIGKITQILRWVRDERPALRVGLYGILPLRDYWTPAGVRSPQEQQRVMTAWRMANDRLGPLVEHVDFVCPSLYTFYDDAEGNLRYVNANLAEARRYRRPVYPFIWFEYHDSNPKLAGQLVPLDMLSSTCCAIRSSGATGIVLWGGFLRPWTEEIRQRVAWIVG